MALVRLPEGQQRSGNQGGIVWSHNRFGPYIRPRSIPVNPNTQRQVDARLRVKILSVRWNNILTQIQRDAWDLYGRNVPVPGRFGTERTLTGMNMYVRSNTAVMQAGLTIVDDAPIVFTLGSPEGSLTATGSTATQQVSCAYDDGQAWVNEDGGAESFYQGRPVNAGIKFFGGPYRHIGSVLGDSTTPPTSPELLASAWPFAAGQRGWLYSRIMRADGRLSAVAEYNFLYLP